jgi:hypothetical protein
VCVGGGEGRERRRKEKRRGRVEKGRGGRQGGRAEGDEEPQPRIFV